MTPLGLSHLDEPDVHLHPAELAGIGSEITHQAELGSQFLIVTHNPLFALAVPGAHVLEAGADGRLRTVELLKSELYLAVRRKFDRASS
jgi:predicted ATPase